MESGGIVTRGPIFNSSFVAIANILKVSSMPTSPNPSNSTRNLNRDVSHFSCFSGTTINPSFQKGLHMTKNPILFEGNGAKGIFRSFTHPLLVANLLNFALFVKKKSLLSKVHGI
jgi:hypothetical protein